MPIKPLTKTTVDRIPFSKEGVVLYYDTKLKGFGVRVSKSTKAYFAEGRVNGKTRRVKLGVHGTDLTTEVGRKKAQKALSSMNEGKDPNAEKHRSKERNNITLSKAFDDYLEARKDLKPKTLYDYKRLIESCFSNWKTKALLDISPEMVAKKHRALGENQGKAYANLSMRLLSAIFNFASAQYGEFITVNPVKRLSDTRAWYKIERRRSIIKLHELEALFKALNQLKETSTTSKAKIVRDYIFLLLFTGLRRQEAAQLQWDNVDFKSKTITVLDTKNREPHSLPLSDFLFDLLKKRKESHNSDNPYVFPGSGKKARHLVEPRVQMQKVFKSSGIKFSLHDLRRTFATIAEGQVSAYQLKRLLNHKAGDVTAGYIVTDIESLRPGMQKITDTILRHANLKTTSNIVRIRSN